MYYTIHDNRRAREKFCNISIHARFPNKVEELKGIELTSQPEYSPNLVPSNYYLS